MADKQSSEDRAAGAALAAAAACERICRSLTHSLGFIGSRELLARALSRAQTEHSALKGVSVSCRKDLTLHGVARAAESHGESGVVAGLETLLSALLALLGRLIGVDMVARVLAQSAPIAMAREDER
jgi:hypothetical protein